MFGHNNTNATDQDSNVQHGSDTPADGTVGSLEPETIAPTAASTPATPDAAAPSYPPAELPGTAPTVVSPTSTDTTDSIATPVPQPAAPAVTAAPVDSTPADQPQPPVATPAASDNSGLLALKQSALHELSPLLGHLDQTPEERFRTTMMMIQASDDQSLLQSAYDAAKGITDEKARAQALLDVVNEINYFTQAATTDAS